METVTVTIRVPTDQIDRFSSLLAEWRAEMRQDPKAQYSMAQFNKLWRDLNEGKITRKEYREKSEIWQQVYGWER